MSKEPIYPISCWQGYINHIKESLGRVLTENEYKTTMQAYIHKKDVEKLIEEMKNELI